MAMTEMQSGAATGTGAVPRQRPVDDLSVEHTRTGWVGWIYFAGLMAILVGVFQGIAGLVALLDDGYYVVTRSGLAVHMTYNEWGWIHIALGLLLIAVGAGMILGQMWARVAAVVVASLSAIANFLFIKSFPAWSVTMIALDILVIYAVSREVKY
jgi:hypothetical protein